MTRKLKVGMLLSVVLTGVPVLASAGIVDCVITDYVDPPYTRATLESLLPGTQRHVIDGGVARYGNMTGIVTQDDANRLKWRYKLGITRQAGMPATLSYTIIRPRGQLIVRVETGAYNLPGAAAPTESFAFLYQIDHDGEPIFVNVNRVDGTCIERP